VLLRRPSLITANIRACAPESAHPAAEHTSTGRESDARFGGFAHSQATRRGAFLGGPFALVVSRHLLRKAVGAWTEWTQRDELETLMCIWAQESTMIGVVARTAEKNLVDPSKRFGVDPPIQAR
jgi:hypothetical protein